MKISVIIPTYNEAKHISDCIDSLTTQTYKDYEIIVVDDGSIDKTVSIVKSKKIILIEQNHKGAGAARNLGSKKSSGDILVFVDADMIVSQNFLEEISKPIIKGNSKGTFTKNEVVLNYDNIWAKLYNWEYVGQKTKYRVPKTHQSKSKIFRAILKSEFERVGGYDEVGYGEDWTLSKKLGYKSDTTNALVLHKNPENPVEVFNQSSWIATRKYKLGELGRFIALIRASLLISIIVGIYKAIKFSNLKYIYFKIVFDLGIFVGIISFWLNKNYAQ